ncbi:hypothetical protein FXO38_22203 [Capsicum annuum]|nr:hypothetical protein FXO38_22203 [Capsicum annuum]
MFSHSLPCGFRSHLKQSSPLLEDDTDNKNSEAVRTEPFFTGTDGDVYWRLKCYGNKSILLSQDVGADDTAASDEKWSAFDVEQKEIIEKRINYLSLVVACARGMDHLVMEMYQSHREEQTRVDLISIEDKIKNLPARLEDTDIF